MNVSRLVAAAMLMFGLACGATAAAQANGVGRCAWAMAAEGGERAAFLAAFARDRKAGTSQLSSADPRLMQYVSRCARRGDLPGPWARSAVASVALQDGFAAAAQASSRISRPALDMAWAQAPAPAKDCARANAAKVFGLSGPSCPDMAAATWFLQHLGLSPTTDRPGAAAALSFMNAKAQEEWAESLIARFVRQPPS